MFKSIARACCAMLLLGALVAPQVSNADKPDKLEIVTLSSRPDTVSGGNVLVKISYPANQLLPLWVTLNDHDTTGVFRTARSPEIPVSFEDAARATSTQVRDLVHSICDGISP